MQHYITIQLRALTPNTDNVDFSETFAETYKTWADIATITGEELFDKTNVSRDITHIFYIRYNSSVTEQSWILFKGQRYDIIQVENLDARKEFMALRCNLRGCENIERNTF